MIHTATVTLYGIADLKQDVRIFFSYDWTGSKALVRQCEILDDLLIDPTDLLIDIQTGIAGNMGLEINEVSISDCEVLEPVKEESITTKSIAA